MLQSIRKDATSLVEQACLSGRDELFLINLEKVLYMQADDHYSHIYYSSSHHFLVPYGLSAIEEVIAKSEGGKYLMRLGRKYIVNLDRIFYINNVKSTLSLADDQGKTTVLHISKPILRGVVEIINSHQRD